MVNYAYRALVVLASLFLLTACNEDEAFSRADPVVEPPTGGSPPPPPPPPPPPDTGSFVSLSSDDGDFVGAGLDYLYTNADSILTVTASGGLLSVGIDGDELWSGEFQLPDTYTELEVGTFENLTRYPFHDAAIGGLSWSGEGRGCNTLTGSFIIDSVTYDAGTLTDIELSFVQFCEGGSPALSGTLRYDADDPTVPPGPVADPGGLWEPLPGTTPDSGNYIYLASESGDFVGNGPADYLYTDGTATISVGAGAGSLVAISVDGTENWDGEFIGMNFLTELEPGYYADLQRWPFHNPVKGGLSWSGEGRGCNTLTGWFVVDAVTYDGDMLTAIDLRFQQNCEGGPEALYGEISWAQ